MNNNIQESYCSFEVSKLLKEKGFGIAVTEYWQTNIEGKWNYFDKNSPMNQEPFNYNDDGDNYLSRPTHALAIEWVLVNFGVFITLKPAYSFSKGLYGAKYHLFDMKNGESADSKPYDSRQEATEAALKYVLTLSIDGKE